MTFNLFVGGLVGRWSSGLLSGSHSAAHVAGTSFGTGGLVGDSRYYGTITDSCASGPVTGTTRGTGGLVGYSSRPVVNSYATGDVTSPGTSVGGLVGETGGREALIANSYATGDVTGDAAVGGLLGFTQDGLIENSHADGDVTGNASVGGLAGAIADAVVTSDGLIAVTNSHATGAVTGSDPVGSGIGGAARQHQPGLGEPLLRHRRRVLSGAVRRRADRHQHRSGDRLMGDRRRRHACNLSTSTISRSSLPLP